MWRAQERARSARSRKNGARSVTIKSRALGALKLASEASCARWECARKAGRFFFFRLDKLDSGTDLWSIFVIKIFLFEIWNFCWNKSYKQYNHKHFELTQMIIINGDRSTNLKRTSCGPLLSFHCNWQSAFYMT